MYSDKVCLLGVCVDSPDNFDIAANILKDNELEGMEAFEEHGKKDGLCTIMEILSYPTYILLNPDGHVVMRGSGLKAIDSLGDVLSESFGYQEVE